MMLSRACTGLVVVAGVGALFFGTTGYPLIAKVCAVAIVLAALGSVMAEPGR